MTIFLIALLGIFAYLTWRNLETGVLLFCALLPSYLIRFSIGGVPTTFLEMMALIVIGVWGIRKSYGVVELWSEGKKKVFDFLKKTNWSQPSLHHSITPSLCLLLIAATIGIFVSPDKQAAIGVWKAFYAEPILMFFVVVNALRTSSNLSHTRIFQALGVSALLISLFGLVQYFFSIGIPAPWDLEHRITSVFDYPNALALFLEPIIVISWFQIKNLLFVMSGVPRPRQISIELLFWILVSVLSTISVFLAQSEAGIAALVLTALGILLFSKASRKQTLASILIVSALIFAIPTSRNYLVEKLTFQDSSEQVRLSQWKETIALLKDHPVMGVGLSGYPIALKPYHHDLQYEIFQYPHNIILNIWVELGLLGLVAFFLLAFQMARMAFAWEGRDPPLQSQAILFGAIFFEIIIHSLVDVPYFKNDLAMMTWILIACALAAQSHSLKKSRT